MNMCYLKQGILLTSIPLGIIWEFSGTVNQSMNNFDGVIMGILARYCLVEMLLICHVLTFLSSETFMENMVMALLRDILRFWGPLTPWCDHNRRHQPKLSKEATIVTTPTTIVTIRSSTIIFWKKFWSCKNIDTLLKDVSLSFVVILPSKSATMHTGSI